MRRSSTIFAAATARAASALRRSSSAWREAAHFFHRLPIELITLPTGQACTNSTRHWPWSPWSRCRGCCCPLGRACRPTIRTGRRAPGRTCVGVGFGFGGRVKLVRRRVAFFRTDVRTRRRRADGARAGGGRRRGRGRWRAERRGGRSRADRRSGAAALLSRCRLGPRVDRSLRRECATAATNGASGGGGAQDPRPPAPLCSTTTDHAREEEPLARRPARGHANDTPVQIAGSGWKVEIRQPQ